MNRIALMVLKNLFRLPTLLGKLGHYAKHTDEYPELEKYQHIQYILQLALNSGNVDLQLRGKENIPRENGFMMYANHQGMFDVVAIGATCDNPLAVVMKKELKDAPLLKQILQCTNSFAMDREDVRQSLTVIQSVIQEVKRGRNYLIFPEGTRSKNGNIMGEFHGGSFRCALKAKCPIVPVAFVDSFRVLDQKGSMPLTVYMSYLEPITYEEYQGMNTTELAALVKGRIQAEIDRILGQ
jgi:1-acyl-sn-glycerol-3-phosphate acyltransferase